MFGQEAQLHMGVILRVRGFAVTAGKRNGEAVEHRRDPQLGHLTRRHRYGEMRLKAEVALGQPRIRKIQQLPDIGAAGSAGKAQVHAPLIGAGADAHRLAEQAAGDVGGVENPRMAIAQAALQRCQLGTVAGQRQLHALEVGAQPHLQGICRGTCHVSAAKGHAQLARHSHRALTAPIRLDETEPVLQRRAAHQGQRPSGIQACVERHIRHRAIVQQRHPRLAEARSGAAGAAHLHVDLRAHHRQSTADVGDLWPIRMVANLALLDLGNQLQTPGELTGLRLELPLIGQPRVAQNAAPRPVLEPRAQRNGQLVGYELLDLDYADRLGVDQQQQPLPRLVRGPADGKAAGGAAAEGLEAHIMAAQAEVLAGEPGLQHALGVRQLPPPMKQVRQRERHVLGVQVELHAVLMAEQLAGGVGDAGRTVERVQPHPVDGQRIARPTPIERIESAQVVRAAAHVQAGEPAFSRGHPGQSLTQELRRSLQIEFGHPAMHARSIGRDRHPRQVPDLVALLHPPGAHRALVDVPAPAYRALQPHGQRTAAGQIELLGGNLQRAAGLLLVALPV